MQGDRLFDLTGRVAAVIGGTGVLGGALCHGLGQAGASVAVIGLSSDRAATRVEALRSQGVRAVGITADATAKEELEAARGRVEAELGPVDILVNAAGVNSATPFFDITLDEWHRLIDVNLTSVFLGCQVFARSMIDNERAGSIINISSASSGPPLSRVAAYSVAKAGLNNLTQYLAAEFAPQGIRVNAIAPGFFPAEQNRALLSPDRLDAIYRHTPAGRLGEPPELVGTCVWLASNAASGYVTGAIVRVDGGFSAKTI